MQAGSFKEVFIMATDRLAKMGYTVADVPVAKYKAPLVERLGGGSCKTTWKSLPIEGTSGVVVVRFMKVTGMRGDYDAMVSNGEQAFDMQMYAMTQPEKETYNKLLG